MAEDDEPVLGVQVAGWPAVVVDVLLRRHGAPYLKAMSGEQRREVETFRRAVHAAALYWQARASVTEVPEPSTSRHSGIVSRFPVLTASAPPRTSVSASAASASSRAPGSTTGSPARSAAPGYSTEKRSGSTGEQHESAA